MRTDAGLRPPARTIRRSTKARPVHVTGGDASGFVNTPLAMTREPTAPDRRANAAAPARYPSFCAQPVTSSVAQMDRSGVSRKPGLFRNRGLQRFARDGILGWCAAAEQWHERVQCMPGSRSRSLVSIPAGAACSPADRCSYRWAPRRSRHRGGEVMAGGETRPNGAVPSACGHARARAGRPAP